MYNILIAEDEKRLREVLKDYFERSGYHAIDAADGGQAIEVFGREKIDIALLDIMMPVADGFEVCKVIRETSDIPVIFLTAKTAEEDQLHGFNLQADDYVTKPFSLSVLLARVENLLKRYKGHDDEGLLSVEGITVSTMQRQVCVDGETVEMPPRIFDLLVFFMENKGRILSREQLLDHVWGRGSDVYDRSVDSAVKKLRKYLGKRAGYVHTIIKVGYRFQTDEGVYDNDRKK